MGDGGDLGFGRRLIEIADRVTVALDQLIPPAQGPEANLMRAMRHAALANGKRMRPFYVIETGAMFDAPGKEPAAYSGGVGMCALLLACP